MEEFEPPIGTAHEGEVVGGFGIWARGQEGAAIFDVATKRLYARSRRKINGRYEYGYCCTRRDAVRGIYPDLESDSMFSGNVMMLSR